MKKKLLVLAMVIFATFGLFGCVSIDISIGERFPTLSVLLEKNQVENLLETHDNVTITTVYGDEESPAKLVEYFYKIDGQPVMDSALPINDAFFLTSQRGNVEYYVFDGSFEIAVFDEVLAFSTFFEDMVNPKLLGGVYEEKGFLVAQILTANEGSEIEEAYLYHTAYFNKKTFEVEKMVVKSYRSDLSELATIEVYYTYDSENAIVESVAYDLHASSENPIEINLVIRPEESDEFALTINTDKSALIDVYNLEFKTFPLYLDPEDTVRFSSLSEVEGDSITLYAIEGKELISLDCSITQEFVYDFENLIAQMKEVGLEGDKLAFDDVIVQVEKNFNYLDAQTINYEIEYYKNPTEETSSAFVFVNESRNHIYALYNEALKELAISSPIKDYIFAGYTSEELEQLQKDNTQISELRNSVEQLTIEYNELEMSSPTWGDDVDTYFLEISKLNHQIALLSGYDNVYDYYTHEVYKRYYTVEELQLFRQYVQKYVKNLYGKANENASHYSDLQTTEEFLLVFNLYFDSILENQMANQILFDYIESYMGYNLYNNMMSAFDDNAVVFATNPNSLGTAFASYNYVYEHGLAYFSARYQTVFNVTHELGHYASFYHYDYNSIGYDVAEIHSQANEWLLIHFMQEYFSEANWNYMFFSELISQMLMIVQSAAIDEFEETFYKELAQNPDMTIERMREIRDDVVEKYTIEGRDGIDSVSLIGLMRQVTIESPVYYLSYATSQIASISYSYLANEHGLEFAKEKYVDLLENVNPSLSFKEMVSEQGLFNPFEEQTYKTLSELFERNDVQFNKGRQDAIFAEVSDIRPLLTLTEDNPLLTFDEQGRILVFFCSNDQMEYDYIKEYGTQLGYLNVVSADELVKWYNENSSDITDFNKRITQLLGYKYQGEEFRFIGMWVEIEDLYRIAYQTDVTKQLLPTDLLADENGNYPSIDDRYESSLLLYRNNNLSPEIYKITPVLGYTYDWGGSDVYGLSEFILEGYAPVDMELLFENTNELINWIENAGA